MKKILLIHGVFFQAQYGFGIGYKPGIGSAVTLEKVVRQGVYSAIVGPGDNPSSEVFLGQMHDYVGYSAITDFKMTETELRFTKRYGGRKPISYVFTEKEGNVWTGTWEGIDCGRGVTRCVVTEVTEGFLQMEESVAMEMLAQLN